MKKPNPGYNGFSIPVLLLCASLAGCNLQDDSLALGQSTWQANCQVCHLQGIAGAPPMGDKSGWQPRIAQGESVLIEHALRGFEGDKGYMPARGGNSGLSDEQVIAAVRYMITNSQ